MDPEELDDGDERTTAYVMEVLGDDLDKGFQRLSRDFDTRDENGFVSFDEADAREFVRAAFAEIEGTSFCLRMWCAQHLLEEGRMSERERLVVFELTLDLRDGKVVEKPAKIRLEENIQFTFALLDRVHRIEKPTLDTSEKWWSDFKTAIRVRHRLTHPRIPADLDVSSDELMAVVSAEGGFRKLAGGVGWACINYHLFGYFRRPCLIAYSAESERGFHVIVNSRCVSGAEDTDMGSSVHDDISDGRIPAMPCSDSQPTRNVSVAGFVAGGAGGVIMQIAPKTCCAWPQKRYGGRHTANRSGPTPNRSGSTERRRSLTARIRVTSIIAPGYALDSRERSFHD